MCDPGDAPRLEAQTQLLEPEQQPLILSRELESLPSEHAFEWIGGRLTTADLDRPDWSKLSAALLGRCSTNAGLRLLISSAECGPAEALILTGHNSSELDALGRREKAWRERLISPMHQLEADGWSISSESWVETLTLSGGRELTDRWLCEGSSYRSAMAGADASDINQLKQTLEGLGKEGLQLPMRHQMICGHRMQP